MNRYEHQMEKMVMNSVNITKEQYVMYAMNISTMEAIVLIIVITI